MELKHLDQLTPVETIADDDAIVGIFNSDINIAKVEDIAEAAGNILIDGNKVATPESVAQAIVNAEDARQYGVCINHATGSPTLERIGAAVGLKAEVATGDSTPVNDFDYIYPYSEMRKCTLADDGTVTAYEGEPTYKEDGSIGQVMVEIPKFYIRRFVDATTNKEYIYICKKKLEGYALPECFKDRDGNENDYVYIAAYLAYNDDDEENPRAWSVAGKELSDLPSCKHDNYYKAIGNRAGHNEDEESEELYLHPWHNLDVHEMCMLQMLFMVEFATTDSESIFGGMYRDYGTEYKLIDATSAAQATNTFTCVESLSKKDRIDIGDTIAIKLALDYDITPEEGAVRDEYEEEGVTHFIWEVRRKVTSVTDTEETRTIIFDGVPVTLDANSSFKKVGYFTGCTNEIKASSGNLWADEAERDNVPFVWRGFENFFSCFYTWVSGILISKNTDGGTYRVTSNLNLYGNTGSILDYADSGQKPHATDFTAEMTFDKNNPLLMVPVKGGATDADGYCDKFTLAISPANVKCYRFGGTGVGQGGLFAAYASLSGGAARCRLAYHHY